MKTVLSIKNLNFSYSKQVVLEDINLEVKEKEFLAVIGANGGGKSTLLKLILGLLPLKEGEKKLYEKKIGYVPQNTNINNNFPIKVWEVVSLGFKATQDTKDKTLKVLKQVGMEKFFENKIGSLSGGQRQRIMIARALFNNPKLLLLDEPTSNIDPKASESIYELLKELNKKITIIVVSHDLSVILKYATKIAYINKNIFMHESPNLELNQDGHFCEVELMQMLEGCSCKSC
jgi:zinc transport system ATP-binding protein